MVGDALAGWAVVAAAGSGSPRVLGPRAPSPPPRATDTPSPPAGSSIADVSAPFCHSRISLVRRLREPHGQAAPAEVLHLNQSHLS